MSGRTAIVAAVMVVLVGCEDYVGGLFGTWPSIGMAVTSPNGGEVWVVGEVHNITWKAPGEVGDVEIHYSTDGWVTENLIVPPVPGTDETFAWTIPGGVVETTCRVRVQEVGGAGLGDRSNADFEIRDPFIQVTAPNGGENLAVGDITTITWIARGVAPGNVDIHYSTDSGVSYAPGDSISLDTVPIGDGSCSWTVDDDPTLLCRVRVREAGGGISDESDADFTIARVTVTAPDGAEVWNATSPQNITWTSTGVTNVRIQLSRDDGATWEDIVASVDATTSPYSWDPVTGPASILCKVRISDAADASPTDDSDATFTIVEEVTVTVPDGGETWAVSSSQNITWTSAGITNVRIELSRDDGSSWEDIIASTPAAAGSYTWDPVTAPDSALCLVRVSDAADGVPSDESNAVFDITP